jgi:hypothetical protein
MTDDSEGFLLAYARAEVQRTGKTVLLIMDPPRGEVSGFRGMLPYVVAEEVATEAERRIGRRITLEDVEREEG